MRSFLAVVSIALNRMTGGEGNQYLCARIAEKWGAECLFCRAVAFVLREPGHCADQLSDWLGKK